MYVVHKSTRQHRFLSVRLSAFVTVASDARCPLAIVVTLVMLWLACFVPIAIGLLGIWKYYNVTPQCEPVAIAATAATDRPLMSGFFADGDKVSCYETSVVGSS